MKLSDYDKKRLDVYLAELGIIHHMRCRIIDSPIESINSLINVLGNNHELVEKRSFKVTMHDGKQKASEDLETRDYSKIFITTTLACIIDWSGYWTKDEREYIIDSLSSGVALTMA